MTPNIPVNRSKRDSGLASLLGSVIVLSAIALLSVVAGLVATTAEPFIIGLFAGAALGVLLLLRMDIALWLVMVGTLLIGGLVHQFLPQFAKAVWLFSMVGFLLLLGACIQLLGMAARGRAIPWFAWLTLAFPVYAVAVTFVNASSILEFAAGFKRYFQFWGVFAALVVIPFSRKFHRSLLRFLFVLCLVQVLFAVYQLLFVVPTRVGLAGGVVPIDAVSGTFESNAEGGGASSILSMFVLLGFCFVLSAWRNKALTSSLALAASIPLLAPLFLGETKIVILLLPLVVYVAVQHDLRRKPFFGFLVILVTAVITAALAYLYLAISAVGHDGVERTFERIIAYNFGDVGYHGAHGLNRTTVLSFWWSQQSWADPLSVLFGHGIGSSYAGPGSFVPGHLALKYSGLYIGFTGLSTLLWDTGIIGAIAFIVILGAASWAVRRASRRAETGNERALCAAVEAGLLVNMVFLFYSDSMFALPSHEVMLMLLLAAAAIFARQARDRATRASA